MFCVKFILDSSIDGWEIFNANVVSEGNWANYKAISCICKEH